MMYSCAVEYWLDWSASATASLTTKAALLMFRLIRTRRLPCKFRATDVATCICKTSGISPINGCTNYPMRQKATVRNPTVSQVCLAFDRIESIELSQNRRFPDSAMLAVADKIILQSGYYQNLLNEPLPKLHNFTLNEMINGWRLLQSLASVVFDEMSARIFHNAQELPRFASVEELLRFAPKIASRVLCATVSKALRLEKHEHNNSLRCWCFVTPPRRRSGRNRSCAVRTTIGW